MTELASSRDTAVLPDTAEPASSQQDQEVEYWLVHDVKLPREAAAKYAQVLASVGCDSIGRKD
jgi:hypothetical protein